MHICIHMYTCLRKPGFSQGHCSPRVSHLTFGRLKLTSWAILAGQNVSACPSSQHWDYKQVPPHLTFYRGAWDCRVQVPELAWQTLYRPSCFLCALIQSSLGQSRCVCPRPFPADLSLWPCKGKLSQPTQACGDCHVSMNFWLSP